MKRLRDVRQYCTTGNLDKSRVQTSDTVPQNDAKPFAEIPGPRGPLGMGTLYKYLPVIGDTNLFTFSLVLMYYVYLLTCFWLYRKVHIAGMNSTRHAIRNTRNGVI